MGGKELLSHQGWTVLLLSLSLSGTQWIAHQTTSGVHGLVA